MRKVKVSLKSDDIKSTCPHCKAKNTHEIPNNHNNKITLIAEPKHKQVAAARAVADRLSSPKIYEAVFQNTSKENEKPRAKNMARIVVMDQAEKEKREIVVQCIHCRKNYKITVPDHSGMDHGHHGNHGTGMRGIVIHRLTPESKKPGKGREIVIHRRAAEKRPK